MISSLVSEFKLYARRALFVGTRQAAVYHWRNNDLGDSRLFDVNEEGRENFRRYLAETAKIPFYVLVDVFEEEYRQDTIPHVFGPDRRAFLNRKAGRLFKDTPYCFHQVTGREAGGRRDDRVLLTAITNPAVIRPWTAMLEEATTPLAGICSLPLFTGSLLKLIADHAAGPQLIVSLQSISGLRQTFFHNGKFHISRLVQMPSYGVAPYSPYIRDEVEKIRRYLNSLRLITPEEPLHIYFLLVGDLLKELQDEFGQQETVRCHFCDVNELLAKSGSGRIAPTPFSDPFFIQRLLKLKPGNYYAGAVERRYFSMRRLHYSVTMAGVLLLLVSAGWSGLNFLEGMTYQRQSVAEKEKAQFYAARYELARKRLPETPVEPADLKVAVDIANTLTQYKSSPIDMAQLLSGGLDHFPVIQMRRLVWFAATDPEAHFSVVPSRSDIRVALDVPDAGTDRTVYHVALLEGRIEPFDGNFREAMETVNRFAEDLRSREPVHSVSIVALPLDVSPGVDLQGDTQSSQRQADFTLRVVAESKHET